MAAQVTYQQVTYQQVTYQQVTYHKGLPEGPNCLAPAEGTAPLQASSRSGGPQLQLVCRLADAFRRVLFHLVAPGQGAEGLDVKFRRQLLIGHDRYVDIAAREQVSC